MYIITYCVEWEDESLGKFGFSIDRQMYVGSIDNFRRIFMERYDGNGISDVTIVKITPVDDLSDIPTEGINTSIIKEK